MKGWEPLDTSWHIEMSAVVITLSWTQIRRQAHLKAWTVYSVPPASYSPPREKNVIVVLNNFEQSIFSLNIMIAISCVILSGSSFDAFFNSLFSAIDNSKNKLLPSNPVHLIIITASLTCILVFFFDSCRLLSWFENFRNVTNGKLSILFAPSRFSVWMR